MAQRIGVKAAIGALLAVVACGGTDGSDLFSPDEAGTGDASDASSSADGASDGTMRDGGVDGTADATSGDASSDAARDAGIDSGVDASIDAGVDAGVDASVDASVDSGVDAAPDTGVEAATCDAVVGSPKTWYADPVAGSDASGSTGSGTRGGLSDPTCSFKTVTHGLQVIGAAPPVGSSLIIVGPSTVAAGESWPLAVPQGLTVFGKGGLVTVAVPNGSIGFTLAFPSSGLANLTIDGSSHNAMNGVNVLTGSSDSTTITGIIVQNFGRDGILVQSSGVLTIGPGVSSTLNGTNASRWSGLHVTGSAHVSANITNGQATTSFTQNTANGILIDGNAYARLAGVVGSGSNGTFIVSGNFAAGIRVQQTVNGGSTPQNIFDGLVVAGTTNGSGIWVFGGSNLKLRNSLVVANSANGVLAQTNVISVSMRDNDVSKVDLGSANGMGHNVLQLGGSAANSGSGVCLQLDVASNQTLAAQGNVFTGRDCSTASPGQISRSQQCFGATDIGLATSTNDIDVTNCTHP